MRRSPWAARSRSLRRTRAALRPRRSPTPGFGYTDPQYAPAQMLFAGHCGSSGAYWWNAHQDNSWTGQFMGITGWQTFNNGHTDAALITLQGTTLGGHPCPC